MIGLTTRQREVYDFVCARIQAHGYPPSFREIGAHFRFRSTKGVVDHVSALERKGYLRKEYGKMRSLVPIAHSALVKLPEASTTIPIVRWRNPIEVVATTRRPSFALTATFGVVMESNALRSRGILADDWLFVDRKKKPERGQIGLFDLGGGEAVARVFDPIDGAVLLGSNRPIPVSIEYAEKIAIGTVVGMWRPVPE